MLSTQAVFEHLPFLIDTAVKAGEAIREVYERNDLQTERKADNSPLTLADRRAHDLIDARLRELAPQIPVLSEEGVHVAFSERGAWDELWMVDPLDGTKEFIRGTDEFTVNIALVQRAAPVFGVVYAPVHRIAWVGIVGRGAWKIELEPGVQIDAAFDVEASGASIAVSVRDPSSIRVVASRSHMNAETRAYIDRIEREFDSVDLMNAGSSLKLCLIAEGTADLYPRHAPTCEWDTAAGHAVVLAAGGEILQAGPDAELVDQAGGGPAPLRYNKENLLNPWFVARAW